MNSSLSTLSPLSFPFFPILNSTQKLPQYENVLHDSGLHDAVRACEHTAPDVRDDPRTITHHSHSNVRNRSPSHSYQHAHLQRSAHHSPPSPTGSPLSTPYTHRVSRRSQRPSYTHAYIEPYSGAWDAHMRRCVRVYEIRGRGMRRLRRCWAQRDLLGALRRCGRFLGLMKRVVVRMRKTRSMKRMRRRKPTTTMRMRSQTSSLMQM